MSFLVSAQRPHEECAAEMQPPCDTYQHLFRPSARSLPDIPENPSQDRDVPCQDHDDVSCRCYRLTEHKTEHQDSKCTSSRDLSRTSLMSESHKNDLSVTSTRTDTRGAAYYILIFAVVGVAFVLISAMAYMVVSLSNTQAHLVERVTSLEHRLTEAGNACDCRRPAEGESGQRDVIKGERRNNKFAFLMAQGHAKLLEGDTESKPDEVFNLQHELKDTLETITPEIHPKVLIRLEEARSTPTPPQVRNSAGRDSAALDDESASPNRMPVVSQRIENAGRYQRSSSRRKGKDRHQPEQLQRGRASTRTGHSDLISERNSTDMRGVHFQANLNRTTTIGVAGWVPYWALSSSFLKVGSPEYTDEIKSEFRLSARGNVTVRTAGLYYVYSQMMYYDPNEYIGHSIVVDGVEAFTCIAPITGRTNKYKTCFIGGLVYIPPRGKVGIKMLYTPRRVCLFEDTSYFGMFRVT